MPGAGDRPLERLGRRLGLEPQELRLLGLMGALVATLMCGYTIAKVLRDALFLAEFGGLALPYGYIGVALASAAVVWLEGRISRRFTRVGAATLHQYVAIALSVFFALEYTSNRHLMTALFYLWTGSQVMMLLPYFWVMGLDVWDSRRARRVFPILGGCGLIGGMVGGAASGGALPGAHRGSLMWILPGLLILAHLLTRVVERHRKARPMPIEATGTSSRWEIIRRSKYIKVFVAGLALSVIVSTLVDFQFKLYIRDVYADHNQLARFLGKFYVALNGVALLFQFGVAGWLIQRFGLAASTGLQPSTVILFSIWAAISTGWWPIVAMRWIQGVVFQSLGKSAAEIYYTAIRPHERRSVKPLIDTLVERWSDAVVGVLLIVALKFFRVPLEAIGFATAVLATTWLALLLQLNRYFGHAFQEALGSRWTEPAPEAIRIPAARKALLEALHGGEERRVVLALQLSVHTRDAGIARAVRECLRHPSPEVRRAAVTAMVELRLTGKHELIEGFLHEPHEGLRRAALEYLVTRGARPAFARELLEGPDADLRLLMVEALAEHPSQASELITPEWIDARIAAGTREDLLLAACALAAMPGRVPADRVRSLLAQPDVEVRRQTLISCARRPNPDLLDALIELLPEPGLGYEALQAMVALGNTAVPALERMIEGTSGARAQVEAVRALAEIASSRAAAVLIKLARGSDVRLRQLALRGLTRIRMRVGRPVLSQKAAHRMFLRELEEFRISQEPALALHDAGAPEIRLLAESWGESATMALQRAIQSLSCWYEPRPLFGVFERLTSPDRHLAAPALEYLGHILPGAVFRTVQDLFEDNGAGPPAEPDRAALIAWIDAAWRSPDAWLRACAVRAARAVEGFDTTLFNARTDDDSTIVRAELEALFGRRAGGRTHEAAPAARALESPAC